jgi:methylated-DNA-[protein]-cysteine S-methyltransferase
MTHLERDPISVLGQPGLADDEVMARLRSRLVEAAATEGVLDVVYRTVDTPVGALLIAATPAGLVRVAYPNEDHDQVLDRLAALVSPRVLRDGRRLDRAAEQIDEYFARRRRTFELPMDLQLPRGFRRTVLEHLPQIAYGTTATYSAIAAAAGSPKAVRAVGSACATNPLPLLVPCHRVVRSDGTAGEYVGGSEVKRALLTLEAA